MSKLSVFGKVLKKAALDFNDDNGFKLSASLSYSTIFAVGPLLILVISLAGIFLGRSAVEGRIYASIKDLVGSNAALQIQDIIKNIRHSNHTVTGAIVGGGILLLAATGVFTEIQGSINYMWCIQTKPKKSWLKFLLDRLLSFSMIIGFGFISLVSLILTSLVDVLGNRLKLYFPNVTVSVFYALNNLLTLIVIVFLFTVIFRILPDVVIRWRDAIAGAIFTGVFFVIGKFLIGVYLGNSNIGQTYGAVTSLVVILTWVYYSSIILYFGAEFTKGYAAKLGTPIEPSENAVMIVKEEIRKVVRKPSASSPPDSP